MISILILLYQLIYCELHQDLTDCFLEREGDTHKYFSIRSNVRVLSRGLLYSIQERIAMSSLQGLPPLPRSLSGFNLNGGRSESGEPPPPPTRSSSKSQRGGKTSIQSSSSSSSRPSPPARQLTTLDTQLAVLRREMVYLSVNRLRSLSPHRGMRSRYLLRSQCTTRTHIHTPWTFNLLAKYMTAAR